MAQWSKRFLCELRNHSSDPQDPRGGRLWFSLGLQIQGSPGWAGCPDEPHLQALGLRPFLHEYGGESRKIANINLGFPHAYAPRCTPTHVKAHTHAQHTSKMKKARKRMKLEASAIWFWDYYGHDPGRRPLLHQRLHRPLLTDCSHSFGASPAYLQLALPSPYPGPNSIRGSL